MSQGRQLHRKDAPADPSLPSLCCALGEAILIYLRRAGGQESPTSEVLPQLWLLCPWWEDWEAAHHVLQWENFLFKFYLLGEHYCVLLGG